MVDIKRQSPVVFPSRVRKTDIRAHWEVVRAYEGEGAGPWLTDLSHQPRWDIQDGRLDSRTVAGLPIPSTPGDCRLENRLLINRMNRTQAAIWHLGDAESSLMPPDSGLTDVSEATVFLALFGPKVAAVSEKLTALDLMAPGRQPPYLLQGPYCHVPCQLVVLAREPGGAGALLLSCARGYARDMVDAILHAGAAFDLRPAGEDAFTRYLEAVPFGNP
jgi:hypothetical protein